MRSRATVELFVDSGVKPIANCAAFIRYTNLVSEKLGRLSWLELRRPAFPGSITTLKHRCTTQNIFSKRFIERSIGLTRNCRLIENLSSRPRPGYLVRNRF